MTDRPLACSPTTPKHTRYPIGPHRPLDMTSYSAGALKLVQPSLVATFAARNALGNFGGVQLGG